METTAAIGHYFGNTALPIILANEAGNALKPTEIDPYKAQFLRGALGLIHNTDKRLVQIVNGIGSYVLFQILGRAELTDWTNSRELSEFREFYDNTMAEGKALVRLGLTAPDQDYIEADREMRKNIDKRLKLAPFKNPSNWLNYHFGLPWPERMRN